MPSLPPFYTGPAIELYSGNNCTSYMGWFHVPNPLVPQEAPVRIPGAYGSGWQNDQVRSMKLVRFPAGTRIRVCDNSNCWTGDDWVDIRVNQNMPSEGGQCFHSFEPIRHWDSDLQDWIIQGDEVGYFFSIYFHYRDNLDGKVSLIAIDRGW